MNLAWVSQPGEDHTTCQRLWNATDEGSYWNKRSDTTLGTQMRKELSGGDLAALCHTGLCTLLK